MSGKHKLKVDWCSHAAAKCAVERWHYSKTMPVPPQQALGVWEGTSFVGAVVFAKGANYRINEFFGLAKSEVAELVRVALKPGHAAPVSQVLKYAMQMVRLKNPGLRLFVSYADTNEGHHGGIYQAGGWVYLGMTSPSVAYESGGMMLHKRAFTGKNYGKQALALPSDAVAHRRDGKHRYAIGLDKLMREWLEKRRQAYPKRAASIGDAPDSQSGEPGSIRGLRSQGMAAND